jgi:hypothetical protein
MIYCLLASLNLIPNSNDSYIKTLHNFLCCHWSTFIRALLSLAAKRQTAFRRFFMLKIAASEDDLGGFAKFAASKLYNKYKVHNIINNKQ